MSTVTDPACSNGCPSASDRSVRQQNVLLEHEFLQFRSRIALTLNYTLHYACSRIVYIHISRYELASKSRCVSSNSVTRVKSCSPLLAIADTGRLYIGSESVIYIARISEIYIEALPRQVCVIIHQHGRGHLRCSPQDCRDIEKDS